jgi:hypothetical protein
MRRYNARDREREKSIQERDRVIRDAIQAKVPRARIVEITSLSPQRIDQIRRGSRI